MIDPGTHPATVDLEDRLPIRRLMGLAVFGEMLAARIYNLMAQLMPEYSPVLRRFASMEGQHATWFRDACRCNEIEPDKEFADQELDYLIEQVNDHFAAGDHEALAVVQGLHRREHGHRHLLSPTSRWPIGIPGTLARCSPARPGRGALTTSSG